MSGEHFGVPVPRLALLCPRATESCTTSEEQKKAKGSKSRSLPGKHKFEVVSKPAASTASLVIKGAGHDHL